ncbi:uncharacterized protein LOC135221388 isoform X1 [Macrobrachium nipponense]|uniref:uncharacterized protein LOC135221388 isoform X1 n=1 Tax=Macrobrachium nipponense TaxID=159736 RepID=UPI0030C7B172
MQVARALLYADSAEVLEKTWDTFCQSSEAQQYPQYSREHQMKDIRLVTSPDHPWIHAEGYLANLMERKQDWSLLFRAGNIMRGHHTNNYAESNMCLIKDVILNRCKAYNTCQLIMFMNEIYDGYMKQCLLDVALCRRKIKKSMITTIPPEHVTRIDEFQFIVVSDTKKDVHYNVDLAIGMCDCVSASTKLLVVRLLL